MLQFNSTTVAALATILAIKPCPGVEVTRAVNAQSESLSLGQHWALYEQHTICLDMSFPQAFSRCGRKFSTSPIDQLSKAALYAESKSSLQGDRIRVSQVESRR